MIGLIISISAVFFAVVIFLLFISDIIAFLLKHKDVVTVCMLAGVITSIILIIL